MMRVHGLLILIALLPMAGGARGTIAPSPTLAPATERPELEKQLASHEVAESEIERAVDEMITASGKKYMTVPEAGRAKAFRGKRADMAESLDREISRFNEEALRGQPGRPMPSEIRAAWADFVYDCALARRSVEPKRQGIRSQFLEKLGRLEAGYLSQTDAVGLSLIRRAKTCLAIRRAIQSDSVSMTEILGDAQRQARDAVKEGIAGFSGHYVAGVGFLHLK